MYIEMSVGGCHPNIKQLISSQNVFENGISFSHTRPIYRQGITKPIALNVGSGAKRTLSPTVQPESLAAVESTSGAQVALKLDWKSPGLLPRKSPR